LFYNPVILC